MSTAGTSDAAVIAASRSDPEQFGLIFDRHFTAVHGFFERRLGRDDADSQAGEVFRIAFEGRDRYQEDRPDCRPWLYGIAANLVRRHHRHQRRHRQAMGRLGPPGEADPDFGAVDRRLDDRALRPKVAAAVDELRDEECEVLLLAAWEGLRYDEIAVALDLPVGTVRSRLSRGRQRIRERLGLSGEEPGDQLARCRRHSRPEGMALPLGAGRRWGYWLVEFLAGPMALEPPYELTAGTTFSVGG